MITKFQNFKLIKESPDTLWYDGESFSFEDDDARPFYADVNNDHTKVENILIGFNGDTHGDIERRSGGENKAYPGRIWEEHKLMAFWVYPSENLFKQIINRLEDELEIKMFNNGWKIEIIEEEKGSISRIDFDPDDTDSYFYRDLPNGDKKVIPIEQYAGSENVPEKEQIMHLMNWKEKELAKKAGKLHFPKGFGSDKTAWDSPNNIKWRQALRTENKNNYDN